MATISADQLPSPVQTFAPPPAFAIPAAAAPAGFQGFAPTPGTPRRPGRGLLLGTLGAAIAIVGGLALVLTGGDDDRTPQAAVETTMPAETVAEPAGAMSEADLSALYRALLSVTPSGDTLACLSDEVDAEGPDAQRFLDGGDLTFDQALVAFEPFLQCAPDDDFLHDMVPVSLEVLGGAGDTVCIEQVLRSFTTTARTEATAMWFLDREQFASLLFDLVGSCA